jgi:hypothetical protein
VRAIALSTAAGFLVVGCAQLPENIAEAYASDAYYQTLSCQELGAAREPVRREHNRLAAEQRRFVGVLIPPAQASENARKIARYKGELAAIERVERMKECGTSSPASEEIDDPDMPSEEPDVNMDEPPDW